MFSKVTRNRALLRRVRQGQTQGATRSHSVGFKTTQKFNKATIGNESFLQGSSAVYVEQMYHHWKQDRSSVNPSWDAYFTNVDNGLLPGQAFQSPPGLQTETAGVLPQTIAATTMATPAAFGAPSADVSDTLKVAALIRAYQITGHLAADLDPLKLEEQYPEYKRHANPEILDHKTFGLSDADLDREFDIGVPTYTGFFDPSIGKRKLRDIISKLKSTYCSSVGYEYMHIDARDKCNWLRERIEFLGEEPLPAEQKKNLHRRLASTVLFAEFLSKKFTTSKRFGLEGCDVFVPAFTYLVDRLVERGVQYCCIGMPHRGRLSVLAHVLKKPLEQIFAEFQNIKSTEEGEEVWGNSGDVKYHLGTSYLRRYPDNKQIHLNILANPSHLEAVNPVVYGKVASKQYYSQDDKKQTAAAVLIHGDASFAGQGVVYETMQMESLRDYSIGGCIHIVVNNQIGFTTDPREARTGDYCTEIAKSIGAPIFHVNADDPEAVMKVMNLAADFRQQFGTDVVIDLIGYRRFGHNELDQPMFTQPIMYKLIKKMENIYKKYTKKLIAEGVITTDFDKNVAKKLNNEFEEKYQASRDKEFNSNEWEGGAWEDIKKPHMFGRIKDTGVDVGILREISDQINTLPEKYTFHPQIKKIYEARRKSVQEGKNIDWATAEALAWASLLKEGFHVRISGQDVERGTFSHRHCVLHDQNSFETFRPLKEFANQPEDFIAKNSHLSEFGVLGFEYGYSIASPNTLNMWEAQFGDFANEAQVVIDQFIASGESKWQLQSGLVLMLPHGYDGQGPEHSSARLERFLQLMDDHPYIIPDMNKERRVQVQRTNMQIVNLTTPVNYFHALRRQIRRDFRKPLIVMSPKKLLKLREAQSDLEEFGSEGGRFRRAYDEALPESVKAPEDIKRVVICSGQVYYDLIKEREKKGADDVVICRVEQIAPFPWDHVERWADKYPNADFKWCQEEHFNMGAWFYVAPRINRVLMKVERPAVEYAGRAPSASTATGHLGAHNREYAAFMDEAFGF